MKQLVIVLITFAIAALSAACSQYDTGNNANRSVNSANTTNANSAANASTAEADIRKLMDTAQAALSKNDADAMEKIYADNYMLVNLDGSVQNKAERLAALRSGDVKYTSFTYSEPNIRIKPDGTGAIVIAKLSMKGTA